MASSAGRSATSQTLVAQRSSSPDAGARRRRRGEQGGDGEHGQQGGASHGRGPPSVTGRGEPQRGSGPTGSRLPGGRVRHLGFRPRHAAPPRRSGSPEPRPSRRAGRGRGSAPRTRRSARPPAARPPRRLRTAVSRISPPSPSGIGSAKARRGGRCARSARLRHGPGVEAPSGKGTCRRTVAVPSQPWENAEHRLVGGPRLGLLHLQRDVRGGGRGCGEGLEPPPGRRHGGEGAERRHRFSRSGFGPGPGEHTGGGGLAVRRPGPTGASRRRPCPRSGGASD